MNTFKTLAVAVVLFASAAPAYAGPHADELSKCLVESTSPKDRAAFVRWMFASAAAHPAVKDLISVSPDAMEQANEDMARMCMTLLAEHCLAESRKAIKYEGATAFESAFRTLGELAGTELFGSAEVSGAMSSFESYLDEEQLAKLAAEGDE